MEMKDILTLLDRFDASTATQLELELNGARVKLSKQAGAPVCAPAPLAAAPAPQQQAPAAAPAAPAQEEEQPGSFITAPLVGAFYAAPGPDAAPFVRPGDRVKQGQTVCILEAMKMMSEVPAPMDCVIEEVLAQDGGLCEFGAPLFRVREL